MKKTAFGYACQECGRGTVKETVHAEYGTKIRGQPFVATDAHVGVCDACGAEHFAAEETARWHRMFEEEQAQRQLSAEDIRRLRDELQLSMEQFAALIGCTRQSLHNWERVDRKRPQSRMADLLLKLVQESHSVGQVDAIELLRNQAIRVGITIPAPSSFGWKPLVLRTQRMLVREPDVAAARLGADTDSERQVRLVDAETNQRVGTLCYDVSSASLTIAFSAPVEFSQFDVEVRFRDGHAETSRSVRVKDRRATLLKGPQYSEQDVEELAILPPSDAGRVGQ